MGTVPSANGKHEKRSASSGSAAPSPHGGNGRFDGSAVLLQSDEEFWAEFDALMGDDDDFDDDPSPDGGDGGPDGLSADGHIEQNRSVP